jgi:PAS domain S-box-containing protein
MVTKGKQSKSRMDGSEELAKALMRCAGTGIYIVQEGRFQYVNSLFQEMTGYTERELLGVYSLDLVHEVLSIGV